MKTGPHLVVRLLDKQQRALELLPFTPLQQSLSCFYYTHTLDFLSAHLLLLNADDQCKSSMRYHVCFKTMQNNTDILIIADDRPV